jgi:hypothetical protein
MYMKKATNAGKPVMKLPLGKFTYTYENSIKMEFKAV